MQLIPLSERGQQTADGAFIFEKWRAQRIVYIRTTTPLTSYQPVSVEFHCCFLLCAVALLSLSIYLSL